MRPSRFVAVLAVVTLLAVAGCGDDSPASPTATLDPRVPMDLDHLGEATADLREMLGHQLTMRSVDISRSGYRWEVRDPAKPDALASTTVHAPSAGTA